MSTSTLKLCLSPAVVRVRRGGGPMATLAVYTGDSATLMAETIFGDRFTVNTATLSGDTNSSGVYTGAAASNPGVLPLQTQACCSRQASPQTLRMRVATIPASTTRTQLTV